MGGPSNTLLIEGSFEELADELAVYIDSVQKSLNADATPTNQKEVAALLEENKKDEALKKLVTGAEVMNAAPEKEFIAAYNLLVHLIRQSPNLNMFLPKVCQNLQRPITSSPNNGYGLSLSILTTIFNIMQSDNDTRYHVFLSILKVVKAGNLYEMLKPQLENLDAWIEEWETDEEDQRKLYLLIADVADEVGETDESYAYLLLALRTIEHSETGGSESRTLSIRALKQALQNPAHFDFQDLIALDSIQALRTSEPAYFELLELFNAETLDDYNDFKDSHDSFFEESGLDDKVLYRKIRLLTLASLAASTPSRSLPYARIAKALKVPSEDVEMWVIDVIRAGLVEGKLSQLNETFLIHRSTYRVFGDKQWREVATRLETWKESLRGVLEVVRKERISMQSGGGGGGGGAGGERRETDGRNTRGRGRVDIDVGGD